jgi:hypothetical protein
VITTSANNGFYALGDGNVLRDFTLAQSGASGLAAVEVLGASTAERLFVSSSATSSITCGTFYGAVFRDSVCRSSGTSGAALGTEGADSTPAIAYARNVTAIATGPSSAGVAVISGGSGSVELDARNVIASGNIDDVSARTLSSGPAVATMTSSAYDSTFANSGGSVTDPGVGTNINSSPLFVDAPADDFHQLPGSPTVDAGTTDPRTGTTDVDGEPRPQGAAIDIGADELPAAAPDLTAPATSIDRGPRRRTRRRTARLVFSSSEPGGSFECSLDGRAFNSCSSPKVYSRLRRGGHRFAVRAIDAAGNVDTTPATINWRVTRRHHH